MHRRRLAHHPTVKRFYAHAHKKRGQIFFILILVAVSGGLLLSYIQHSIFALNVPIFSLKQALHSAPAALLADHFGCPNTPTLSWCRMAIAAPWLSIGLVETLGLLIIFTKSHIRRTKKASQRLFVSSMLLVQIFALVQIPLYSTIPTLVVTSLQTQAKTDIQSAQDILADPARRTHEGIIEAVASISAHIETSNDPFVLLEYKPQAEALLQTMRITHTQKHTLYEVGIIARSLYDADTPLPSTPADALLFPPNTLVILATNKPLVEALAPSLVRMLVQKSYGNFLSTKKKEPDIQTLEESAYVDILKKKSEEEKQRMISHLAYLRSGLAEVDDAIAQFTRYRTSAPAEYQGLIDAELQEFQRIRSQYLWVIGKQQEVIKHFEISPITFELQAGIFTPPSSIYIKFYEDALVPYSEYIHVLTHEYLHYQDNNESRDLPLFLEEGVTDYLSLEMTTKLLSTQASVASAPDYTGYPEFVEVTRRLLAHIPREEFLTAYFHRNELAFRGLINDKFGTGAYDTLKEKTDQLYYLGMQEGPEKNQLIQEIYAQVASPSAAVNSN